MKNFFKTIPALFAIVALSGCSTPGSNSGEEVVLPKTQQNTYLSHAKPPQEFGFSAFPVKDGLAYRGRVRLHPNHLALAKYQKGTLPAVSMSGKAHRQKASVLIDFSSPNSWMEFNTSQDLNAVFLGMDDKNIPYRGGYNTGEADAYAGVVRQMRIKQLFMENIPFYIRMAMNSLGPLARGIQTPHIDAVLGYDNLSAFEYIQLDPDAEVIRFSSTAPYTPHEDLLMAKVRIVNSPNHGLAVEGAIFGEPTPIVLDFAGDYHFARGDVKVHSTKQVSLGDVVYRKVPTLLLPLHNAPPRAGRKMLDKYIVTICNREGMVYFERIPK